MPIQNQSSTDLKKKINEPHCTVYFDGGCPLCSKEIATYQNWRGAENIVWIDASRCHDDGLGVGLNRQHALAELHVRDKNGTLVSGAAAFITMWAQFPAVSWITQALSSRPMLALLTLLYRLFLRIRPLWRKP